MAKVARASFAAVQSAAEAQQFYPAIQELLSTYSLASRQASPEGDAAATTLPTHGDLASSTNDKAASTEYRQYADPPAESMQQPMQQQNLPLRVWHAQTYAPAVGTFHQQRPSTLSSRSSDLSTSSSSSGSSSSSTAHRGSHSASAGTQSSKAGGQQTQSDPLTEALNRLHQSPKANKLTPSAIVEQLDKYIVGQPDAKRAVAVALRNRWRRHMLPSDLAEEITPKNILMIGPTGCGKTEIARRLAQLVSSPFIKVEATKFTELGFVGRDVDEIVKDLMEASLTLTKTRLAEALREVAEQAAEDIILAELIGSDTEKSIDTFRHFYRIGQLDGAKLELDLDALEITEQRGDMPQAFPFQALSAMMEMMQGRGPPRGMPGRQGSKGTWKGTVAEARKLLTEGEIEKSLNSARVVAEALRAAQQDGIVFIDEIDKIVETSRGVSGATSSNVSSEGVQRDLLPILEGSVVPTKYGNVSTDHVLFIASGAFHSSKPSDMLAELQGRLPVRVELAGLTAEDFYRILTEPQHNMIKQQQVLLATEGVDLVFTDGAIRAIAEAAHQANRLLDNIGARRLHTVVERVLAEISFSAPDRVAEAQQQDKQEAAQPAASSSADVSSTSTASSSKGSRSKAARSGSRSKGKEVGSSSDSSSSSASRSKGPAMLQYVVTEDIVNSCMKEVLKQKDLSRYML